MAVEGADDRNNALAIVERDTIVALTFSVDVSLIARANRVAEAIVLEEARFAEASIAIAVVVVSRRTVGADTLNTNILWQADTSLSGLGVELVGSLAWHNGALLSVLVVSLSRLALRTNSLNNVVSLGAVALS